MPTGAASGFVIILLGGLLQGSVLTPMKYLPKWSWENIWLVYSTFAYLLMPWAFALLTVPHLVAVFSSTPVAALLRTLIFGFLWGLAVVTFGLGCELLGLALGYAIILGLGASIGSMVPLIAQHRRQLWAPVGIGTMAGVVLLTLAVVLFAMAGQKRQNVLERQQRGRPTIQKKGGIKTTFFTGLVVCVLCGVLNPLYNIAFAYGASIQSRAVELGASPANSGNAVWLLVANAGYFPSFIYCLFLLRRSKRWGSFHSSTPRYWLFPFLMGFIWISGTVLYGMGANFMGQLGPVIGWPVLMSTMVLTANLWGVLTGEWKGIRGQPIRLAVAALLIMIAAMFMLGFSSKLQS